MSDSPASLDIRARLRDASGGAYWRSLDELAGTGEFRAFLENEFPRLAALWDAPVDRRTMLKLMGASLALAGLGGCGRSQPAEDIVPWVRMPEGVVPGIPRRYATALPVAGYAEGVIVETHEGRPTKIEGNPDHPASLGATSVFAQAAVLGLYDPDRSRVVLRAGRGSTWDQFLAAVAGLREMPRGEAGRRLRILTGPVLSPTLAAQLGALLDEYPGARWHCHTPAPRDAVRAGAELALGRGVETVYRLERAETILSLDGDFLGMMPGHLRYARDFAAGRLVREGSRRMSRLYALESTPTLTGAKADHRLGLRAGEVEGAARAIARRLGLDLPAGETPPLDEAWLTALVDDLRGRPGRAVVVPGDHQSTAVHALAQAINGHLGAFGETVRHVAPPDGLGETIPGSLAELADEIRAGEVETLLVVDCNPAYTAPAGLAFAEALERVPFTVHWGGEADETAARCAWHVPAAHPLESWSDLRAFEGTASILQPMIAPLYRGRTAHELLSVFLGDYETGPRELVASTWRQARGGADFEAFWRRTLHDGVVEDSGAGALELGVRPDLAERLPAPGLAAGGIEVNFRLDPTVGAGEHANNAWLQELPKPLTKLTWDNAALVSPAMARDRGLENGDLLRVTLRGRAVEAPAWILPGHPDGAVTLTLGYGRTRTGRIGRGTGFDVFPLRPGDAPWFAGGGEIEATGARYPLATTQHHHGMEERHPVRRMSLARYLRDPRLEGYEPPAESLYPGFDYSGHHGWGMVIDSSACIGCQACVVACQAENNIPVVGKDEVLRGHEMHWLRVDRYYQGPLDNPDTWFQPVPCMHCEKAPCEYVCPVEATLHDHEGLNLMIYNRCVGTRFCSQNCPYKVRRFNWLDWNGYERGEALQAGSGEHAAPDAVQNPNVTVRSRGVMEKCTYCVQRIAEARKEASREDRPIPDGAVRTACQQACPTEAIVFGDATDPATQVSRLKGLPINYLLLAELNTRPRTSYLAAVTNPNPALANEGEAPDGSGDEDG